MSSQRSVIALTSLLVAVAAFVGLGWAGAASAKPSFAINNGNSCKDNGCHVNVETGRIQVVGEDGVLDLGTQLDGKVRGQLDVFRVIAGDSVTLSVEVLNGDPVFALQFKRLEKSGQLNDLANFMTWMEENLPSNVWTLQEATNPPYFTKDNGNDGGLPASAAGVYSFDLAIDAATPPDVYDLEFAIAGKLASEDLFYQDQHFYLEVVPEPAVGAAALTMLAALGVVVRSRRLGSQ
jgi:hypothetical protein